MVQFKQTEFRTREFALWEYNFLEKCNNVLCLSEKCMFVLFIGQSIENSEWQDMDIQRPRDVQERK